MASLLHPFGRGRVIAAAVVVVTAGLLLALTRMVFSHPADRVRDGTGNRPDGEPAGHVVLLLDHGDAEPECRRCRQYS